MSKIINSLKNFKKHLCAGKTKMILACVDATYRYHRTVQLTDAEASQNIFEVYSQKPCRILENVVPCEIATDIQLSVIIPVYNGAMYLRDCLESILGQNTTFSYEVICVDDGSTDSSPEILHEYMQDSRIKVITQQNTGISGARNRGLAMAKGKYIMFVDNDDVLAPGFLKQMLSNAIVSRADIVKCGYRVLHDSKLKREYIESKSCVLAGRDVNRIYSFNGFCWGTLFARDLLRNFSFPEGYWYEDMVTRLALYPRCEVFSYVGEALYYYRFHNKNASGQVWNKQNSKALDQYFLTLGCYEAAVRNGFVFTPEYILAIQYEISIMLYHRTEGLDVTVREAVFTFACSLNDSLLNHCPEYAQNGSRCQRMLNETLKKRDYKAWQWICKYSTALY